MSNGKKNNLGRGLNALLGDAGASSLLGGNNEAVASTADGALKMLETNLLFPSPYQPRQRFSEEAINDLVESIKEKGVLQPLLVRKSADKEGMYEIIAGERRWRASKQAGLTEVPVIEKEFTDVETLEVALIENLQRQDLSALEEAEGYQRLIDEFEHTQEKLATVVGKSRSHVANTLRLLTLPSEIKELVEKDKLSAGHARALIGCENALGVAAEVVAKGLNVRQTEALVKKINSGIKEPKEKLKKEKDIDIIAIEEEISASLGMKVQIDAKENSGKVVISYSGLAQLDKLLQKLSGVADDNEVSIAEQLPITEDDSWAMALAPDMGEKEDIDSASLMTDAEDSWSEESFGNYENNENEENNLNGDDLGDEANAEDEDDITTLGEQLNAQDEIINNNEQYSIEDYLSADENEKTDVIDIETTNVVNEELIEESFDNIEEITADDAVEVEEKAVFDMDEMPENELEEGYEWEEVEVEVEDDSVEPQIDGSVGDVEAVAEDDVIYETIDITEEDEEIYLSEEAVEEEFVDEVPEDDFDAISDALADIHEEEVLEEGVEEMPLDDTDMSIDDYISSLEGTVSAEESEDILMESEEETADKL